MLKQFLEGFWRIYNAVYFRVDRYEDNIDRCAFFYEINIGWYSMYDPNDDPDDYTYMMGNK